MISTTDLEKRIDDNALSLYQQEYQKLCISNDRVFSFLLAFQWASTIALALIVSPRTWIGQTSYLHIHVIAAIVLGGLLTLFPIYMNTTQPGAVVNRYVNVVAQGLYSALLIHITGGRIETHFHIFGSLAFFAFYLDLRVLLTGTLMVVIDHLIRGVFLPQSVFGIFEESNWRWIEHGAWVCFEDFFLAYACVRGVEQMKAMTRSKAEVMAQNEIAEALVQLRTTELLGERNELKKQNDTIQTIYRNVKSGFLLVNRDGLVQDGFTHSCQDLLGAGIREGGNLSTILCSSLRDRQNFQLMLEQVFDDLLPEDFSLEQLPNKHQVAEKMIRLVGSVVRHSSGEVNRILFTITDITDLIKIEKENAGNFSLLRILSKREVFYRFILDTKDCFKECRRAFTTGNHTLIRFRFHSLKGNASIFGLDELTSSIHEIEDNDSIAEKDIQTVEIAMKRFLNQHFAILNIDYDSPHEETYPITKHLLDSLADKVASPQSIKSWISEVKHKPAIEIFDPFLKMGDLMATKLSKKIKIQFENPNFKIDAALLRPVIQNFSHLLRNSIDHGIMSKGNIAIGFSRDAHDWIITFKDDGRGINIEKVSQRAIELRRVTQEELSSMTEQEKLKLIFEDGLSTAESLTHFSGRGVGMSAVAEAVRQVNGQITVSSSKGLGTRFEIRVPIEKSAAVGLAA